MTWYIGTMIVQDLNNKEVVVFKAEDSKELRILESFPGFLKDGLNFYAPGKPRVVANLFARISKVIKPVNIKFTAEVKKMVENAIQLPDLPADFTFFTKPLPHQLQALRFMYQQGSCGLLLDPGLGKTKIILDYIHLMSFKKALIVCPKPLLYVWEVEVAKHRPEISLYIVKSTDWESEREEIDKAQVVVVNYNKAVTLEEQLKGLGLQFIALDEGLIKNYDTDRTKSLTRLGKRVPYKCVMSGTLINNSPLDCFSPIRFVEPASVGEGVTKFKDRYATVSRHNRNIILGYRDMPEIKSIIDATCIVMRKEEWLKDLPKKHFHLLKCALEGEALQCYNSLVSNWIFESDGVLYEFDNALSRLGKLLQIANGFSYITEEDPIEELEEISPSKKSKKRKTKFFENPPKIKEFLSLIEGRDKLDNRRAIVWFNFQAELEMLEACLKKEGLSFITIKGGDKDIGTKIKMFNEDPSIRFLLGQAKTINYGATILGKESEEGDILSEYSTTISDQVFFSLNFSLEVFMQQQDRIHRIGQTKECHYWIIITNSCIESKIYKAMEDKVFVNRSLLVDFSKQVSTI